MHKLDEKFSRRYHCSYKLLKCICVLQHEKKVAHVELKSPLFQLVLKQVSYYSCSSALRGTGQETRMDWSCNGFLSHWQLSCIYLKKKSPRNWISKTWHIVKAYIHLNAWKPHCEDVSGERCQRICKLDHYALSHPKEQSWLSDRICSMQHHSMSTNRVATVACIMETNTAITTASNYLSEWCWCTSCSQKGQFQHP